MAKLINTFSWSFSAANDFEQCPRKRYWAKYASWGGWDKKATTLQKTAYRLNKMDNIYSIQGQVTEQTIMWILREHQQSRAVTAEQAYDTIARPVFKRCWSESKRGDWRVRPKQFCCLREHYHELWTPEEEHKRVEALVAHTKICLQNFIERTLPRIAHVQHEQEIPVVTPEHGGDPESFLFNGVKIYAIPDYVYEIDGVFHIHDWKAGKVKSEHAHQLALYGLWAHEKYNVSLEHICCYVEYLATGKVAPVVFGEEQLEEITGMIGESVSSMSMYLQREDLAANEPVPQEEWDMTPDIDLHCKYCNFTELCKPEQDA